jgi:DUF4097 and DUF4098 domain-containing protein YvlB
MRIRVSVFLILLALAVSAAPLRSQGYHEGERGQRERRETERDRDRDHDGDRDLAERDEIRQTLELSRGARVEVSGINGSVEIETTNGGAAEVHIVRSANDRADLEYHKIIVEHSPDSLVVRGEKDRERNHAGRNRQVRQRVMMKVPRQIDLTTSGINGKVGVGSIDGPVRLSGINGKVDVAQARGYSHISGINGRVSITITDLGERGIHVSGINGGVELQFAEELNADLDVSGVNGAVSPDVANVTIQGKLEKGNFRAKIGTGGSPISVSGVNGRVRLTRVGATG